MADADEVDRSLDIARAALLPPAGARERVRSQVTSQRAFEAEGARAPRPRGVTKLTTTVLVGVGFVAGYWLGLYQSGVPSDGAPAAALPASTQTAAQPLSSAPSVEAAGEVAASGGAGAGDIAAGAVEAAGGAIAARAPTRSTAQRAAEGPESQPRAPSGRALRARRARPAAGPQLDELTLLSRAERALRAEEAALALTFLDELDRLHPRSTLLEERMAARLLADCMLELAGAPARAERFVRDRPESVYSDRLRSTCAIAASGAGAQPAHGNGAGER